MRLIDADALERTMYHKAFEIDDGRSRWNSGLWIRYKIFEEALRDAPTVDAEPVIRCRDCIEFRRWDDESGECYDGLADGAMVRVDGYCYAAERKSDGIQK